MTSVWRELYQTVGQLGLQPLQGLLRPLEVAEAPQSQILQPLHSFEVEETLVSDVAIVGQMQPLEPVLKQKYYITECPDMICYHIYYQTLTLVYLESTSMESSVRYLLLTSAIFQRSSSPLRCSNPCSMMQLRTSQKSVRTNQRPLLPVCPVNPRHLELPVLANREAVVVPKLKIGD